MIHIKVLMLNCCVPDNYLIGIYISQFTIVATTYTKIIRFVTKELGYSVIIASSIFEYFIQFLIILTSHHSTISAHHFSWNWQSHEPFIDICQYYNVCEHQIFYSLWDRRNMVPRFPVIPIRLHSHQFGGCINVLIVSLQIIKLLTPSSRILNLLHRLYPPLFHPTYL